MPLKQGWSRETQSQNIRRLMRERKPQAQAVAISLETARRSGGGARGVVGPNPNRADVQTRVSGSGPYSIYHETGSYPEGTKAIVVRRHKTLKAAKIDALQTQRALGGYVTIQHKGMEAGEVGPGGASWLDRANRSKGAPYGGVGTATRYSGQVRVKVSYDDRTNQYRAAISVLAIGPTNKHEYVLRTKQVVGRPAAATGSVDSAAAFDDAARAALSFAMHEDKIDPSEMAFDASDGIVVSRTRQSGSGNISTNRIGSYDVREIGRTGVPMSVDEYAWQVAERLVRVHGFAPDRAEGAVNEWAQYVRTAYSMALGASTAAKNVAHRAN